MNDYSLSDIIVPMREGFDVSRESESDIPVTLGQTISSSLFKDKTLVSPSKIGYNADKNKAADTIEGLQSKIRELEKKAQLQNVLHEELALEMAAIKCTARSCSTSNSTGIQANIPPPVKCDTGIWPTDIETFSPDSVLSAPGCSNLHTSVQDTVSRHQIPKCTTSTEHNCYTSPLSRLPVTPALPPAPLTMNLVPTTNLKTAAEAQYHSLTLGNTLDRSCLKPQIDLAHHTTLNSHHQPRIMPQVPATALASVFDLDRFSMMKAGGFGGLHQEHSAHDSEVDMLDIPGKGRCYVYIAKYYYDPFAHSPNDYPEAELCINAGDYLLVWGGMDEDGFFDGELLDGRRGLVPSNFIQKLVGDDLLEFHQSVVQGLRDCDDTGSTNIPQDFNYQHHLHPGDFSQCVPGDHEFCDFLDDEDEDDLHASEASDVFFSVLVAAPKQLTLERQLNKSVLIGWNHPDTSQTPPIDCYHVYVDGVLKVTVKATERPRALVEGVDSNRPHRISVRSVTVNRRTSRDAACTMVIGKDVPLGPTTVRACRVTATSAVISWMPSNSNYQHTVCVNNVELRTVKPGIYRHTITGLAPNTVYRVTVKAKNIRAPHFDEKIIRPDRYSCHIDFCTLPKGLPEPPSDIQLEAGPQDGTVLVTWHPVSINSDTIVTGYSVYADGKKVTDVDSPTGDHALIDINKLLSLNPKQITVRTKAHDSQSSDSIPTQIPSNILKGRSHMQDKIEDKMALGRHSFGKNQQRMSQVVIETEDNLSDKEIYPNNHISIPAIEITKDNEMNLSEDDSIERHMGGRTGMDKSRNKMHHRSAHHQPPYSSRKDDRYRQSDSLYNMDNRLGRNRESDWNGLMGRGAGKGMQGPSHHTPSREKQIRWFVALFDYDPTTMSPNPDACDEELPFLEGDSIKVYGDKDHDGFYWGECKGRRGFVPHNMVVEVQPPEGVSSYRREMSGDRRDRDRWGDIYANMTVKKMIALYDYDPEELSPNPDAEVELSFRTGDIIYVYGEMDDDGFYIGELNKQRGLVPSNFLTGAPSKMENELPPGNFSKGGVRPGRQTSGGKGHGPGARGPPLPPRQPEPPEPHKDACPAFKPVEQRQDGKMAEKDQGRNATGQGSVTRKYQAPINPLTTLPQPDNKPSIINNITNSNTTTNTGHNFMQKLTDLTSGTVGDTSVDNILSKGKELIFMKFGLGK